MRAIPSSLRPLLLPVLLLVALPGCSLQKMALDQTAGILKNAMPAFEREWDYELARAALPGNIKMVEGFLESGPGNRDLLLMAAQAYTSYALVFLEDTYQQAEDLSDAQEKAKQRAVEMYLRGHRYGLRLLEQRRPALREALKKGGEALNTALAACDAADVPGIFWTGMPLAAAVNLAREDVAMIARIPKAKALVQRVLELDPDYYHAASHMIMGGIYGGVGPALGGDPDKAKEHFETALSKTKRRFLLVQVMMAQTYAVQVQQRELFDKLLDEVIEAELSIYPEQKLANVAAKRRARRLKERGDELF